MSSSDMNFAIVEFSTTQQDQLKYEMTVIVPRKFLAFDHKKQMYVYYLTPPFTPEDEELLSDLTRTNDLRPPESWNPFMCNVLYWSNSYEEAEQQMMKLNSTNTPEVESMNIQDQLPILEKNLFTVPAITEKSNEENTIDSNTINATTDDTSSKSNCKRRRISSTSSDVNIGEIATVIGDTLSPSNSTSAATELSIQQGSLTATGAQPASIGQDSVEESNTLITKQDLLEFKTALLANLDGLFKGLTTKIDTQLQDYKNLDVKIRNIVTDINQIKTFIKDNRVFAERDNVISLEQIQEVFEQMTLPIENYLDFQSFDAKIVDDKHTSLKNYFNCNINTKEPNVVINVVTPIFKTFFTKDLLSKFTAQKKSKDKYILKKTNYYKCLLDAMQHAFNSHNETAVSTKTLLTMIGSIINNAPDWDGGRAQRMRKALEN